MSPRTNSTTGTTPSTSPSGSRVPGFINADRWIGSDNPKLSVATYDLDAVGVLHSPPYQAVGGANGSPWTKRVTGRVKHIIRLEGDQILPGDGLAPRNAAALLVISMNPVPEAEAEFNAWYNEEHLPALGSVPGVLMARRYRGQGATQRYLAMYHFAAPDVREGAAWKNGRQHAVDREDAAAFPRLSASRLPALPARLGRRGRFAKAAQSGVPLPAALLRTALPPRGTSVPAVERAPDAPAMIGQERAAEAVAFALRMRHKGYNVYALGPGGVGRHALVEDLLQKRAQRRIDAARTGATSTISPIRKSRIASICRPGRALASPGDEAPDRGVARALPAAFEHDEYRARREVIDQQVKSRSEEALAGCSSVPRPRTSP